MTYPTQNGLSTHKGQWCKKRKTAKKPSRKGTVADRIVQKWKRKELQRTYPNVKIGDKLRSCVINLSSKIKDATPHQLLCSTLEKIFKYQLHHYLVIANSNWIYYNLHINYVALGMTFSPESSDFKISNIKENINIKEMEVKLIENQPTKQAKISNNHCLELYIDKVTKELLQTNTKAHTKLPSNLPEESQKALMDMQKWKEVVIRPSDKGSKYFLLDRNDYKDRVHEHIYDATTFVSK